MAVDLRSAQRDLTRQRILDAAAELVAEGHPAALSVPAVAERSGVSVRTIYRRFPTKEALLDAITDAPAEAARALVPGRLTVEHLAVYLSQLWRDFAARLDYVRANHASAVGRDLRRHRLPRNRADAEHGLALAGIGLDPDDHARLRDLVVALTSSSMMLELVDRQDHEPEDAAALAAWAVHVLLDHVRRTGKVGDE